MRLSDWGFPWNLIMHLIKVISTWDVGTWSAWVPELAYPLTYPILVDSFKRVMNVHHIMSQRGKGLRGWRVYVYLLTYHSVRSN